jgi:flagellar FliJ protein
MKHYPRFDIASEAALREAPKIRAMIVDIERTIRVLDCDIATEEERTRVSNRCDAAYPILARMLAARRDNLKATAADLERRLMEMGGALLLEEFNNT